MDFFNEIAGKKFLITSRASVRRIMQWIERVASESASDPKLQHIAEQLGKSDFPEKAIFDYAYEHVVYDPGADDTQEVQYTQNTLASGRGNCVQYTILQSALLRLLGVEHKLRRVWEYLPHEPYEIHHIYVVTDSGYVLDPVLGQKQDGTDTKYNRPAIGQFNVERHFPYKVDYPVRLVVMGNTKASGSTYSRIFPIAGSTYSRISPIYGTMSRRQRNKIGYENCGANTFCLKNCKCKQRCVSAFPNCSDPAQIHYKDECIKWCNNTTADYPPESDYFITNFPYVSPINMNTGTGGSNPVGGPGTNVLPYQGGLAPGTDLMSMFSGLFSAQNLPLIFGGGALLYFANKKKKKRRRK